MGKRTYADQTGSSEGNRVFASEQPLRLGGFIGTGCSRKFDPTNGTATSVHGPALNFLPEERALEEAYRDFRLPLRDPGYTFTREEVDSLNDGWTHYESDERRAELEAQMPTYRPPRHPRACASCHLTTCLGPDYHELTDIQDFQQRARSAHRQAGDYNRHTHDYSIL